MNFVFYICLALLFLAIAIALYPVVARAIRIISKGYNRYYEEFQEDDNDEGYDNEGYDDEDIYL